MSVARSIKRQEGVVLWEALVSIFLLGILGMGLVYALTRASVAQRNMNGQNLLVSKIRSSVMQKGISDACPTSGSSSSTASPSISGQSATLNKNCTMTAVSVSALDTTYTLAVPVVIYSAQSTALLGSDSLQVRN